MKRLSRICVEYVSLLQGYQCCPLLSARLRRFRMDDMVRLLAAVDAFCFCLIIGADDVFRASTGSAPYEDAAFDPHARFATGGRTSIGGRDAAFNRFVIGNIITSFSSFGLRKLRRTF